MQHIYTAHVKYTNNSVDSIVYNWKLALQSVQTQHPPNSTNESIHLPYQNSLNHFSVFRSTPKELSFSILVCDVPFSNTLHDMQVIRPVSVLLGSTLQARELVDSVSTRRLSCKSEYDHGIFCTLYMLLSCSINHRLHLFYCLWHIRQVLIPIFCN